MGGKASRRKKPRSVQEREASPAISRKVASLRQALRSGRFRFAACFTLSCLTFYGLILGLPPSATKPLNEHTARALELILKASGISAATTGDVVSAGGLAFRIIPECTPIFTVALLVSLIGFYPATLRQKVVGGLLGIAVLYVGNLARLAATFAVSRYDRSLFDVVHVYLGQLFTMLLLGLVCVGWLRWIDGDGSRPAATVRVARFVARFALISGVLFFVWLNIHHGYIRLLDHVMRFGFSLFHHGVEVALRTPIYYETFSIVGFASLLLASRSLAPPRLALGLTLGVGFLSLSHLLHRIDNGLMAGFQYTKIELLDLTLLIAGQYLLPALLLVLLSGSGAQPEKG